MEGERYLFTIIVSLYSGLDSDISTQKIEQKLMLYNNIFYRIIFKMYN